MNKIKKVKGNLKNYLKLYEKRYINFVNPIFLIFIRPYFYLKRIIIDQIFLVNLNSKKLTPSLAGYPLWLISKIFKSTFDLWNLIYINEGLKVYSKLIQEHYSENGRGYLNFRGLSDFEKVNIYKNQRFGRIDYFIKNNLRTLDYKDGNSFLDLGCGFGQNIIVIEKYFPQSIIQGFDVNDEVISILNKGTEGNSKIKSLLGSITDIEFLKTIETNSFDNVIVSHVFAFIICSNIDTTIQLRSRIIKELVRISKKTLLILDSNNILQLKNSDLYIEQRKRGMFSESIIDYFRKYVKEGEIISLFSDESVGILFKKF